ncbi:MAG: methionyl-tRNA formyltransferase [Rhodospirillaceae bacterium]
MRVIFMGTPDFSIPILEALHEHHTVAAVYTKPARIAGRGQKTRYSPIDIRARAIGLPIFTPQDFRNEQVQAEFRNHKVDAVVVAAYGLILPQSVLDMPKHGCLNVHASLLPRWRGAAPTQRAIMAGDIESGITIMQMDAGLDTGDILLADKVPIDDSTTAGALHDTLSELGARLIVRALKNLKPDLLTPIPQPNRGVTYAQKIEKSEAAIDFGRPSAVVIRHIHGLSPFPGAFCDLNGIRLKILSAERCSTAVTLGGAPGSVISDQFDIACTDGAIRPLTLQRAGKSPTDTASFLRGFELRPGSRVG